MRQYIPFLKKPPSVAVLRLHGVIAARARGALSDAGLAGLIEKAFAKGKPDAVALSINSPGGSPTQSSLISARIRLVSAFLRSSRFRVITASPLCSENRISLYSMGGAIAERKPTDSAFWYRNKKFIIQIESWWDYPESREDACRDNPSWQEPYIDWVRRFRQALLKERLIEGAFINFIDRDLELSEYYGGNFERLKELKSKWDPEEVFHFEMSIPAG